MPTVTTGRFAFRATPTDIEHIQIIAAGLRDAGQRFATRTDAIRYSLELTASNHSRAIVEAVK